jgi:hypothetical protein
VRIGPSIVVHWDCSFSSLTHVHVVPLVPLKLCTTTGLATMPQVLDGGERGFEVRLRDASSGTSSDGLLCDMLRG